MNIELYRVSHEEWHTFSKIKDWIILNLKYSIDISSLGAVVLSLETFNFE